ncbi:hypothetical protein HPB47_023712 [Ixodes persulcatus]|uniref:Uncharacterized protein n=1 Tax=Ixodes persulcatus TaxID=34615 RepID=A0AC60Q6D3_IXOPE|nr:hypothetical protein HPB47_023712 [Ixodes persulcatus]
MGFAVWSVSLALLLAATPYMVRPSDAQGEESSTRNIEEDMNDILKVAVQKFLPLMSDVILRPEVSGDCSSALLKTFLGLQQRKAWALRMALSNALVSSNVLEGAYIALGGYEQCLRTRVRSSSGELYFKGQFCNIFFDIPKDSYAEIVKSFQEIGELQGRLNPLNAKSQRYQNVDPRGAICIPSLCSAEDINFVVRSGTSMQILLFFSAITNTRFLLNTETKPENEPLRFMAGFKVIMAFWVVFGHAHILVQSGFFHALFRWADISEDLSFQFVPNAFLSVTTFFFMSITIPAAVLILAAFILPLLGSGPADEETYMLMINGCIKNWWTVLVHTNNFNPDGEMMLQAALWVTSFCLACFVMFVTYDWNKGHLPGVVVSALYAGFHRHLWSLVFVWPFYACATGRGGLINKFFGWTFFFPLSRLAFSIYLVHFLVYVLRQIRMRTYLNADEYFQFTTSLGVFTLSTFFAYLLYLTVEAPLIGLQKLIFDRPSNPKPEIDNKISLEIKSEKSQL